MREFRSGANIVASQRCGSLTAIANTSASTAVCIVDRHLKTVNEVPIPQGFSVSQIAWDCHGESLCITYSDISTIHIWTASTLAITSFETPSHVPSAISWTSSTDNLAIGTMKGSLIIYDKKVMTHQTVIGRHSKKVEWIGFDTQGRIVSIGDDRLICLSSAQGNSIDHLTLAGDPSFPRIFGNFLAYSLDSAVFIVDLTGNSISQKECTVVPNFGSVSGIDWFEEKCIAVYSFGGIASFNLDSSKSQQSTLFTRCDGLEISRSSKLAAIAVADGISILRLPDFSEIEKISLHAAARSLSWSNDGTFLFAALANSQVISSPLASSLVSARGSSVLSLSAQNQLQLWLPTGSRNFQVPEPPDVLALGSAGFAVGVGAKIIFCNLEGLVQGSRVFASSIDGVVLGRSTAAVLAGRSWLCSMTGENLISVESELAEVQISDFDLVAVLSSGVFKFWMNFTQVASFRHSETISRFFLHPNGTRLVFLDSSGFAYLLDVAAHFAHGAAAVPVGCVAASVLFNPARPAEFALVSEKGEVVPYIHLKNTLERDDEIRRLGKYEIQAGRFSEFSNLPILISGTPLLITQTDSVLSFSVTGKKIEFARDELFPGFSAPQTETLNFLRCDFTAKENLKAFANEALRMLEISAAIRFFRKSGETASVLELEDFADEEDLLILRGHVWQFLGDYRQAKSCFEISSRFDLALELAEDFSFWADALFFAEKIDKERIPEILLKEAQHSELLGNFQAALTKYSALRGPAAVAGRARCLCRTGDGAGAVLASSTKDSQLIGICAEILENCKCFSDAARLYENSGNLEKATLLFLRDGNFDAVTLLLPRINDPTIICQFARAKESTGAIRDAISMFEKAGDYDSVVRLLLQSGSSGDCARAAALVRGGKAPETGATAIAEFAAKNNEIDVELEFLILAGREMNAFEKAKSTKSMNILESLLPVKPRRETSIAMAEYFLSTNCILEASRFFAKAGEYGKALDLALAENSIDLATEICGIAKNKDLTDKLFAAVANAGDYRTALKLHRAMGNFQELGATAVLLARQESELGNYKQAHALLVSIFRETKSRGVPREMWGKLLLLHSYTLIKRLAIADKHMLAAIVLGRVVRSLKAFPKHAVQLLASAFIECTKANMRAEATKYAFELMKPEFRPTVPESIRAKVEQLVRKPDKDAQPLPDPHSPCPYCKASIPDSQLDCVTCLNILPFCIFSGMHLSNSGLVSCRECEMSAHASHLPSDESFDCSFCGALSKRSDFLPVLDPSKFFSEFKRMIAGKS